MRAIYGAVIGLLIGVGCVADMGDDAVDGGGPGGGKEDNPNATVALAPAYGLELKSTMKMEDDRETGSARYSTYEFTARARVTTNGTKLTVRLCDVKLPMVGGYQPQLDADFVAALPAITVNAAITGGEEEEEMGSGSGDGSGSGSGDGSGSGSGSGDGSGSGSGSGDGSGSGSGAGSGAAHPHLFDTAMAGVVLGAQLSNAVTSNLPASGTDSRVRDQDQDGNPGVSIQIPGYGSIYAAMRVKLAMHATLTATNAISGTADITLDQAVYGDDIWFYDAVTSAADTAAHVHVRSADNRFRMKAGATSCAMVRTAFPQ